MRFLIVFSLFLSPVAFGQRVKENLKQQSFVGGNSAPDNSQFSPDPIKVVKKAVVKKK